MSQPAGSPKLTLRCLACGTASGPGFHPFCSCGGMIEVEYDLARAKLRDSLDPYERFFDLLPLERAPRPTPVERQPTPCRHATRLGAALGLPRLYLKDETGLPTGSTKDRMAAVALAFLEERGVRGLCTSSTGNSSTAFARAAARHPALRLFLFTAASFAERVALDERSAVTHFVLEDATFVDAFVCAGAFAKAHGLTSESGFFNPGRREGLKLAFLEATDQVPEPIDWYVQAVSSAMGVWGAWKGARELAALGALERLPRLLCVQQESCAPMVTAHAAGSSRIRPEDIVAHPRGIAAAILRGDPSRTYPHVRRIVLESQGSFVAASEPEIREARRLLLEHEGISVCFAAAAAFAGLVRAVREGVAPREDVFLVNLTGREREPSDAPGRDHRLRRTATGWEPASPTDVVTRELWSDPARETAEL